MASGKVQIETFRNYAYGTVNPNTEKRIGCHRAKIESDYSPTGELAYGLLIIFGDGSNGGTDQFLITINGGIYFRHLKTDGTWSTWQKVTATYVT